MSKKYTNEIFINKSKVKHFNKYDYSKVEYKNSTTKVCIICPEHGEFWQEPSSHLRGYGCPKCVGKNTNTKQFIEKARKVHGDKYDYSKVEYINNRTKVCIICPEHGEFWQQPNCHISDKNGCPKCAKNYKSNTEEFIQKARKIHNNKYDYSKVEYVNAKIKVKIICKKHGVFLQNPNDHLSGYGCPKCNQSYLEKSVKKILIEKNINFEEQKKFNWLIHKQALSLDFYLPDYNVAIECQGIQHFKPIDFFGGEKEYKKIIKRDNAKNNLCDKNNIKLLYYNYNDNIEKFYKKLCQVLEHTVQGLHQELHLMM